jgi:superfamily II DNA/RNA helicase
VDRVQLEPSGKLKTLLKLLQRFERQQQKVLVFSYSVQTLDLLQALAKANSLSYCRLDGTTPTGARKPIIDEFNSNPSIRVFFISTKAGGLGLNLTSASRVVIFDVAWNPSSDLQAQDRAYRLGQRKDVQVYRLVSQGTIEELCYMRQIYKQQLHNLAIAKGGAATTTEEALRELKRTEGVAFDSVQVRCMHDTQKKTRPRVHTPNIVAAPSCCWVLTLDLPPPVQGSKGEEGELFGLYNLMQLSRDSILTRLREQLALEAVDAEGATSSDLQSAVHELVQRAAKARASSQLDIEASAEQVCVRVCVAMPVCTTGDSEAGRCFDAWALTQTTPLVCEPPAVSHHRCCKPWASRRTTRSALHRLSSRSTVGR